MVAGDGRLDSPGHSAKYGSYSLLELTCNKIVDFKLVQVSFICITIGLVLIASLLIDNCKCFETQLKLPLIINPPHA